MKYQALKYQALKYQNLGDELTDETAQLVAWKIKKVLTAAPEHPYQAVFALCHYREQLLIRVVREIYSHYRIIQDESPDPLKMLCFCLEKEAEIESLVQQSMVQILADDAGWTDGISSTDTGDAA